MELRVPRCKWHGRVAIFCSESQTVRWTDRFVRRRRRTHGRGAWTCKHRRHVRPPWPRVTHRHPPRTRPRHPGSRRQRWGVGDMLPDEASEPPQPRANGRRTVGGLQKLVAMGSERVLCTIMPWGPAPGAPPGFLPPSLRGRARRPGDSAGPVTVSSLSRTPAPPSCGPEKPERHTRLRRATCTARMRSGSSSEDRARARAAAPRRS